MRLEQLEYLAAVIQHGSIRRASEHLHVSQPALSESISKLEHELGVSLLDRRRTGARASRHGRELMQNMVEVLEAVDRLRTAAGDQSTATRAVRVGTVSAATSTLLAPTVRELGASQPGTAIELVNLQGTQIEEGLMEGTLDLGLVNLLEGDDPPADLVATSLVDGRPVAVLPGGHPLTERDEVSIHELRTEPFVAMRAGYLMHRFAHRLFGARMPPVCYAADGAELGKLMVAEDVGVTVLPDYSVVGDPLERAGLIAYRPIAEDRTAVTLLLCQPRRRPVPQAVRALNAALVARARAYRQQRPTC